MRLPRKEAGKIRRLYAPFRLSFGSAWKPRMVNERAERGVRDTSVSLSCRFDSIAEVFRPSPLRADFVVAANKTLDYEDGL